MEQCKNFPIQCFPKAGPTEINNKGFFPIVLMSNADGTFSAIDVGYYGENRYEAVFPKSSFWLLSSKSVKCSVLEC